MKKSHSKLSKNRRFDIRLSQERLIGWIRAGGESCLKYLKRK